MQTGFKMVGVFFHKSVLSFKTQPKSHIPALQLALVDEREADQMLICSRSSNRTHEFGNPPESPCTHLCRAQIHRAEDPFSPSSPLR